MPEKRTWRPLALWFCVLAAPCSAAAEFRLHQQDNRLRLLSGSQQIRVTREARGCRVDVLVRRGAEWEPLFDAGQPLAAGAGLDLLPASWTVLEDSATVKRVRLSGRHLRLGYPFHIDIHAKTGSPTIRFSLSARLKKPLSLGTPLPAFGFWRNGGAPEVSIDQGPDSIYRDSGGGVPFGFGFPAAYAWHAGKEAVFFADMTSARWMSATSVYRFHDSRVMNLAKNGLHGLGLHGRKLSGSTVPPGELRLDWHLYAAPRATRPTSLLALDTMIRVCAPLHPSRAEVAPRNQADPGKPSWSWFARHAIENLMLEGSTFAWVPAGWRDAPLALATPVDRMLVHPAAPRPPDSKGEMGWDFSTVNNHLTPWLLYSRLHPDAGTRSMGLAKAAALPLFFDPKAKMIRWGTRVPLHMGDLEMCWQNLFFHIETARAASALEPKTFEPAILGRFLMSVDRLAEHARSVDYLFPQWFDPYTGKPVRQNDVPRLGIIREPWQAGSYAYVMLQAHDISGRGTYLDEAKQAIERHFTRPGYTMANDAYRVTYRDVLETPVTELFGNAYGAVAARKLYGITRDRRYLEWSNGFLHSLLRLTFWYEDRTGPVASSLNRLGLFLPHAGAASATPWESTEAQLALAWLAGRETDTETTRLLLKLSNCYRRSSFHFFPAAFPPAVRALDPALAASKTPYLPIEPFYSLEAPGGHRSPQAAYMAGTALWNYWMFEALATTDSPEILVLNTDTLSEYDRVLSGARRSLVLFNPTAVRRKFRLNVQVFGQKSYTVRIGGVRRSIRSDEDARGLSLSLAPQQFARVTLEGNGAVSKRLLSGALPEESAARRALALAYASLQGRAEKAGEVARTSLERAYGDAAAHYRAGRYRASRLAAERLIRD